MTMADDAPSTAGHTWRAPEYVERMRKAAERYADAPGELEQLAEEGRIKIEPLGRQILVRAILEQDTSDLSIGIDYDGRKAIAHEVLAIGRRAQKWLDKHGEQLAVGDHVFVLSTMASRSSKTSMSVRYWFVDVRDVFARLCAVRGRATTE
jgi:co-chaperonin GroES (HSP10)